MRIQRAESPARLNGHDQAEAFFAACFATVPGGVERLYVAHLDDDANCLHLSVHAGGGDHVAMPVRDIIRDASRLGSAGVILAHNHPSGVAEPSVDDCRATRRLATAAQAIDLALVDHLLFAGSRVASFRRLGLL